MAAAVGGKAYDDDGIELFRGIRLHSPKRLLHNLVYKEGEIEIVGGERVELYKIIIIIIIIIRV
jgi:hypothetical protein